MKKIIISILLVLLLAGCTTSQEIEPTPSPTTSSLPGCVLGEDCDTGETEEPAASTLMDWPIIEFADSLDYVDATAILFYSFDDCPYCREAIPVLDELMSEYDYDIYYVHTERDQREEGNEDYDRIYSYFKDTIENAGYDSMYMPSVFFIKDGAIVGYHVGTVDSHDPSVAKMTDEEIQELTDIYREYLDLMA